MTFQLNIFARIIVRNQAIDTWSWTGAFMVVPFENVIVLLLGPYEVMETHHVLHGGRKGDYVDAGRQVAVVDVVGGDAADVDIRVGGREEAAGQGGDIAGTGAWTKVWVYGGKESAESSAKGASMACTPCESFGSRANSTHRDAKARVHYASNSRDIG
jgi:hypothetical protein